MRLRTTERSQAVHEHFPLLSASIEWIGHPQIRHYGTVGGSLPYEGLGVWEILRAILYQQGSSISLSKKEETTWNRPMNNL
jgi:CO/xanthine dehydrogenase FAD-binding subunit